MTYDVKKDLQFKNPYIDIDEWRERGVKYRYIHGGFAGTKAKFSLFFPEKEFYEQRFYQFMSPMHGSEDASIPLKGLEDKITFALTHGAYFVESNMGETIPYMAPEDPTIIYRTSAQVAEYSRKVAADIYGEHRPYGYIYGGSGGGYKTIGCVQNTDVWDGAVPYIIGTPTSIPNNFTVRAHAKRILRNKLPQIADAMEPGGSGDPFAGLNEEETAALKEITGMGFPLRSWFMYESMDDGALPVLKPMIDGSDSNYYEEFWELTGYLGSNPNGSAVRDRIRHNTKIVKVRMPGMKEGGRIDSGRTGADDSWKRISARNVLDGEIWIELDSLPEGDLYIYETQLRFLSGDAEGFMVPLEKRDGNIVAVGAGFGIEHMTEMLAKVKVGDEVSLDNSVYLALQTYHRHQVPPEGIGPDVWNQFRDLEGKPLYPQRDTYFGTAMAESACGSLQSGEFNCKMIVPISLMDESAHPAQADWYIQKARAFCGEEFNDKFRVWITDHALHGDEQEEKYSLHIVSYIGTLYQALIDISNWVEKGIAPPESSVYQVANGQMTVPADAGERKGVQPTIEFLANGCQCAKIKAGEKVVFQAKVTVPHGTGAVTGIAWSFEGEEDFPVKGEFVSVAQEGEHAVATIKHVFEKPGTYFPVVRVSANRNGDREDFFTQILNLERVRVIVE